MRIVTYKAIQDFVLKHADADTALKEWYHKVKKQEWESFNDVKNTFGSADYVGNNRIVFNVKGNNYRVVCIVIFASKKVYIRFIGTHAEYDKIDSKIS